MLSKNQNKENQNPPQDYYIEQFYNPRAGGQDQIPYDRNGTPDNNAAYVQEKTPQFEVKGKRDLSVQPHSVKFRTPLSQSLNVQNQTINHDKLEYVKGISYNL